MASNSKVADWVHLTEDEEVLWADYPSIYTIWSDILFSLVLIVIGIAFTIALTLPLDWVPEFLTGKWAWTPLILVVAGIVFGGIQYGLLRRTRYVITSEEVYRKEGLISQNVTSIRHDRIQNTSCSQSALERALSFGDITIFTAGSDDQEILLTDVPHPQQVTGIITEALDDEVEKNRQSNNQPTL